MQLECKGSELVVTGPRKISVKELKELGYKLSDKQLGLGNKPFKYGVLEVRNEEGKNRNKEVSFSFLYSVKEEMGIILPNPYNYYVSRPSAALSVIGRL